MVKNEYEYSFKVKKITPYIKYCEDRGYKKIEESFQTRILYTSNNKVLARITTKKINDVSNTTIDFKDEDDSNKLLKISRESIPLKINDEDMSAIMSILDILGYKKHKELVRKRCVYKKDDVIFEIDDYTQPEITDVVAVEGKKEQVDSIYNDIKDIEKIE